MITQFLSSSIFIFAFLFFNSCAIASSNDDSKADNGSEQVNYKFKVSIICNEKPDGYEFTITVTDIATDDDSKLYATSEKSQAKLIIKKDNTTIASINMKGDKESARQSVFQFIISKEYVKESVFLFKGVPVNPTNNTKYVIGSFMIRKFEAKLNDYIKSSN